MRRCESHQAPGIKEVMSEWDIDRSGTVNVVELSAAAHAHKKVKEEGGSWRKPSPFWALFIFVLSF